MQGRVYICIFAIMLLISYNILGQERYITESEFEAKKEKAFATLNNSPFRERRLAEVKVSADSPWKPYSFTLDEYIKPDRSHTQITMTILGRTEPQTDVIRIGDTTYIKRPNDQWMAMTAKIVSAPPEPGNETRNLVVECKQLRKEVIARKSVSVFQKKSLYEKKIENENVTVTKIETLWIDESDRLIRLRSETVNEQLKPFRFWRFTSEYESDKKITIESPIK